jgi:hypothetical protein
MGLPIQYRHDKPSISFEHALKNYPINLNQMHLSCLKKKLLREIFTVAKTVKSIQVGCVADWG